MTAKILRETQLEGGIAVQIVQGNLLTETVDAIVNAANSHLMHGGGVAAAISRAGGTQIDQESRDWVRQHGPVSHAEPAYTHAGNLPCRYVIHTVGPQWGEGDEEKKLADAIRGVLRVAEQLGLASIALPAISTGIFGFPKELAARVIFQAIKSYFLNHASGRLSLVRLTLLDDGTIQPFVRAFDEEFSGGM